MLKIHYHSDCPFFAGCENMLSNFFNSEEFRQTHIVTFSYRRTARYTQEFQGRIKRDLPVYPFRFPSLSDYSRLPNCLPLLGKKLLMAFSRLLFHLPLLVYEIVVLFRLFKRLRPDILHINNGGYPAARSALAAAIAGKWAGIPKVLMVVNNMATDYRHYSRWIDYPIDRVVVSSVDLFITGSQSAGARLRSVLGLPVHKIKAIHNGITLRRATASVASTRQRLGLVNFDGVVFGVVALLTPRKGHQVLLEAILKLVEEKKLAGKELEVLIEGDGPLRHELADFVKKNNLTQWVVFVGNEKNIVDFMSALDVLILPSVQDEDFPNVILEAMALGKPVIASRLAGTPEQVVDGVTGLLVEPRNVVQLSEAICHILNDPNARNDMGRMALERFNKNFASEIALENYMREYMALSGTRK